MASWVSVSPLFGDFISMAFIYILQEISTVLCFYTLPQMSLNLFVSFYIPSHHSLPLSRLDPPIVAPPSFHPRLFYFPFLMRLICSLKLLTLYNLLWFQALQLGYHWLNSYYPHIHEYKPYVSFWVWDTSLQMIFSSYINFSANFIVSGFFFKND